MNNSLNSWF